MADQHDNETEQTQEQDAAVDQEHASSTDQAANPTQSPEQSSQTSDSAKTEERAGDTDDADKSVDDEDDPISALEVKIKQLTDQMLREQAETQNIRKRVQKDVENARKFALERFVSDLLPVLDNMERALQSMENENASQAVIDGLNLTYKTFIDNLKKHHVEQLNPVGEPFDANYHEAVTMVPNPDMEPNSVMDVMQKGYTLNERLVRAAMVVVSKEP